MEVRFIRRREGDLRKVKKLVGRVTEYVNYVRSQVTAVILVGLRSRQMV